MACSRLPRIVVLHDPLTADEHVKLGTSYEAQGLKEMAAQEFQAALRKQSTYAPAFIGLGNLRFEEGGLQEAEDYYRRALDIDPDHPAANNNLAMVYLTRGERLDEAERLAHNALKRESPLQPYILDTLANIYARQGRCQEATTALQEAAAVAPSENKILQERLVQLRRELAVAASCRTE